VNVSLLAEEIRRRHDHLNVALEDIEAMVLDTAKLRQLPILFDGAANGNGDFSSSEFS
jgi:hypothetical protein